MRNAKACALYEEWLLEDDEEAAEMIFCAYLRSLREPEADTDSELETKIDEALDRFLLTAQCSIDLRKRGPRTRFRALLVSRLTPFKAALHRKLAGRKFATY